MKQAYLKTIKTSSLFKGISEQQLPGVLEQLDLQLKHYVEKQIIVESGKKVRRAGLLLEGSVQLIKTDFWQHNEPRLEVRTGQLFLLESAFSHRAVDYTYYCQKNCVVLWLRLQEFSRVTHQLPCHEQLLKNLLKELANHSLFLMQQNVLLSMPTAQEKLLYYLSQQARQQSSSTIRIPYTRAQLADYLSVSKTTLTKTIAQLQKQGWFTCHKNQFILPDKKY